MGRGLHTVLVVDDEELVREIIALHLEDCGHRVVVAADGQEALMKLMDEPGRFDCAVVDDVMPGMSGLDLLKAIGEIRPGLPSVLMSAWGTSMIRSDCRGIAGCLGVLGKPFGMDSLSELIAGGLGA